MGRTGARERWEGLLAKQAASGLSVAEFCRRNDVAQASFYRMRQVNYSSIAGLWRCVLVGGGRRCASDVEGERPANGPGEGSRDRDRQVVA